MKVLQIINSYAPEDGGAQILAVQLHDGYLRRGTQSYLLGLTRSPVGCPPNTYSLGLRSAYDWTVLGRLLAFLRQPELRKLDLVHVHLFPSQLLVPVAARLLSLKASLVTTEHSTSNRRRRAPAGKWLDRSIYGRYDKIACNSVATRSALMQWLPPKASAKLAIIHNGIDLTRFVRLDAERAPKETPIIISVGRIAEVKNYRAAVRALGRLHNMSFEYWIVGLPASEAALADLEQLASAVGLAGKVRFLGFRADVPHLLSQADIFLQTSLWEGFGLAAVEAMAAGLPVVASNVDGLREVVGPGSGAGFLIGPNDEDSFAERIGELLRQPELRRKMGNEGRDRASSFDIQNTIADYLRLYEELTLNPARTKHSEPAS